MLPWKLVNLGRLGHASAVQEWKCCGGWRSAGMCLRGEGYQIQAAEGTKCKQPSEQAQVTRKCCAYLCVRAGLRKLASHPGVACHTARVCMKSTAARSQPHRPCLTNNHIRHASHTCSTCPHARVSGCVSTQTGAPPKPS